MDCEIRAVVGCPLPDCMKVIAFGREHGITLRTTARARLRSHFNHYHPEYGAREKSLLLDEAVEGLG